jgi:hypothetical protein
MEFSFYFLAWLSRRAQRFCGFAFLSFPSHLSIFRPISLLRFPSQLSFFFIPPPHPPPHTTHTADPPARYPSTIAKSLPADWTIAEVLLSSSYRGWGTSSLQKDVKELAECVGYFSSLRPGREIVLMGHSTGCQDVMEYVVGKGECKFSLRVEASSVAVGCVALS